jgi:outer membrane biosynthesis protein TonB
MRRASVLTIVGSWLVVAGCGTSSQAPPVASKPAPPPVAAPSRAEAQEATPTRLAEPALETVEAPPTRPQRDIVQPVKIERDVEAPAPDSLEGGVVGGELSGVVAAPPPPPSKQPRDVVPPAQFERSEQQVATALIQAFAKRDVAAFRRLAPMGISISNMWFEPPKCQVFVGGGDSVLWDSEVAGFLECAATLGLRLQSTHHAALNSVSTAILSFDPAGQLTLLIRDGLLVGIRCLATPEPAMSPVTTAAMLAHLKGGPPHVEPSAELREKVARNPNAGALAQVSVCVDTTGNPTRTKIWQSTVDPDYPNAVRKAAEGWRFRPFLRRGKPVPVCGEINLAYPTNHPIPSSEDHAWLPPRANANPASPPALPPPSPPLNIAPTDLEALRAAGDRRIPPDEATRSAIAASGKTRLVGSFKICIEKDGRVRSVNQLKSTGFADYDRAIIDTIRATWSYRPYLKSGEPEPVCTAVTFLYSPSPSP